MSEAKARELVATARAVLYDNYHDGTHPDCDACTFVADADAYLAAVPAPPAEPRVPREPTPEMSATGDALAFPDHWQQLGVTADEVWRAMYDAAPAAEPPLGEAHPFSYVGEDECGYCNLPREHPIHWRAAPAAEPVAQQPPSRPGFCEHGQGWSYCDKCGRVPLDAPKAAAPQPEAPRCRDCGAASGGEHSLIAHARASERRAAQQPPPRLRDIVFDGPDDPHRLPAAQPEAPTLADEDEFAHQLRQFAEAYPENIFRPVSKEDEAFVAEHRPGLIDRCSAAMGRHLAKFFVQAAARIESDAERIRVLEADLGRYMMLANTNAADIAASRERERAAYELAAKVALDWPTAIEPSLCTDDVKATAFSIAAGIRALATPDSAASPTGGEG